MSKRFVPLTTFFLGLAFCLVGCSTPATPASSAPLSSSGTTSGASSVSVSSTSSGAIKVVFWHTSGAKLTNSFTQAASDFTALVKKNEGVDVEVTVAYQGGYADIESKISKGFATGDVPTLAVAYPDHVADYLAADVKNRGFVCDLSKYANDPSVGFGKESWIGDGPESDFVPAFYQEGTQYAKAGMYSLPFMKSSEAMFYNYARVVTLGKGFTPSGTSTPLSTVADVKSFVSKMSWSDLLDFARYVKTKPEAADLTAPIFYDSDSNLFISQSYQRNIPYLSIATDGKCSVDFNNDQAKAMVKELKSAYDEGLLVTEGSQGTYGSDSFKQEKCLFTIGSTGGTGYSDPKGNFTAEAVAVPYSNSNPLYVSQGITLTILNSTGLSDEENALRTKYAFKFAKYLTSTNLNTALCLNDSEGYSPVRTSCYDTDAYKTYVEDNSDSLLVKAGQVVSSLQGHFIVSPAVKGSAKGRTEVGGILTRVFKNMATIDEAFSSAYQQTTLSI
jgi:multiple sugar transport system substrate-binding protein